jgi:hypothetical protein
MNQRDVDQAVNKYGISRDIAQHLAGGGGPESSSLEQQREAVHQYIQKRWPTEYGNLINKGDFEGMRQAVKRTWFGVDDRNRKKALREYEADLNRD